MQGVIKLLSTGGKKIISELQTIEKLFTSIFKKQQAINKTALKFNKVRAATRRVKGTGLNLSTNQDRTAGDKASAQTKRYTEALNKANKELNEYVQSLATVNGAQNKFTGSSKKITTQVSALQDRLNSLSRSNKEYTSTLQATLRGEQALYKVQRNRAVDELAQFPEQRLKKDGTPDKRFKRTGVEDLVGTTIGELEKGEVANSINGLNTYIDRLEALRAKVQLGSKSFNDLQQQIALVNLKLKEADPLPFSSKIEAAAKGPATKLDSMDAFRQKERFASDLNRAEDKRLQLLSRINDSSLAEITKQKLKNQLSESDVQLQQKELELARATNKEVEKELSSLNKKQQKQKLRRQGRDSIVSSTLIGGGFPFLFGGGPLQAAAGALGGGIGAAVTPGGGFAGSIAATAAMSQISQAVGAVAELGMAMNPLTADIQKLTESVGLAGTETGKRIATIEQLVGKEAALEAVRRRMVERIGNDNTQALEDFGETWQAIVNNFQLQLLKIAALVAKFAEKTGLAKWLAKQGAGGSQVITQSQRMQLGASDSKLGKEYKTAKSDRRFASWRVDDAVAAKNEAFIKSGRNSFFGLTEEGKRLNKELKEANREWDLTDSIVKRIESDYAALVELGGVDTLQKQELKTIQDATQQPLKDEIAHLERSLKIGTKGAEQEKEAKDLLDDQNKLLTEKVSLEEIDNLKLVEKRDRLQEQLELWTQIKDTIAGGLTNAIMGLIEGTKTLSESLAGILKQIAQILIQKALTSWIGGLDFGTAEGGVTTGSLGLGANDLGGYTNTVGAEGAYWTNGIKPFATGGLVTRPTIGLVGEAGEDEYIIPSSKMQGAMERYSAGARGQAVIPGGGTVASGSGVRSTPTVVNYTGPVLSFNSESYVPKSAIPEIINSAARRGAQEGESKVFSKLKNSRSQRSRVGM